MERTAKFEDSPPFFPQKRAEGVQDGKSPDSKSELKSALTKTHLFPWVPREWGLRGKTKGKLRFQGRLNVQDKYKPGEGVNFQGGDTKLRSLKWGAWNVPSANTSKNRRNEEKAERLTWRKRTQQLPKIAGANYGWGRES